MEAQPFGADIVACIMAFGGQLNTGVNLDGKTALECVPSAASKTKLCIWLTSLSVQSSVLSSSANGVTNSSFADLNRYLSDPAGGL